MLEFNELKPGKVIKINEDPYFILKTDHHKMARGGAVLKTKLKNLATGHTLEKTFQGNDKAEEAHTEKKKCNFLYQDEEQAHFMNNENYEQFSLDLEQIGDKSKFLKEGTDVSILYFQDKPIALDLPIKMDFEVTNAPPAVKGNSADNVNKTVEIETGATITTPMFIQEGDIIRINTDTSEYVERIKS